MQDGQESEIDRIPDVVRAGEKPEQDARIVATETIDRLVAEVPSVDKELLLHVEDFPLDQQVAVFRGVKAAVPDSEKFLLELAIARKMADPGYDNHDDPYFVDPLIDMVERGHRVVILYEEPQGGVSRHQARSLQRLAASSELIVVDPDDPDVVAHGVRQDAGNAIVRMQKPVREIGAPDGTEDESNDTDENGAQNLLGLYMSDREHAAFQTRRTAQEVIQSRITDEYLLKTIAGTIKQPGRPDNKEMFTLEDGTEIEKNTVRFVAIVGADEEEFLTRGADEIYLHRPVRVWYKDTWHKARIAGPGWGRSVVVKCDEKVSGDGDLMGGYGLIIGNNAFDLDLSDPGQPEKRHPLEDYPQIRQYNCIRFIDGQGRTAHGWIQYINPETKKMMVETQLGLGEVDFDGLYEIIDDHKEEPDDELLKTGNRFMVHEPQAGKDPVFEIMGVDKENDLLIGKIVSLRRGASVAQVFPRSHVELLGDPQPLWKQYPYLMESSPLDRVDVNFRHDDEILQGTVLNADTLPAYVEIAIKKDPPPNGGLEDSYIRYDVKLEDIVGPVEENNEEVE
jgi:hypothetical protein